MHHSFLKPLPSLLLLVGQIACAAVPGPLANRPYDDDFQPADVDSAPTITYIENLGRADAVRDAFRFAWSGYKSVTWNGGMFTQDEIRPVSGTIDAWTNSRWVHTSLLIVRANVFISLKFAVDLPQLRTQTRIDPINVLTAAGTAGVPPP
jgi:hypothetical protein